MQYTHAQRAAIGTLDEPLLIVACAGSGKTQVISERIVETLRLPGVEPKNIVAFTFTDKAAAELKERVTALTTAAFPEMTVRCLIIKHRYDSSQIPTPDRFCHLERRKDPQCCGPASCPVPRPAALRQILATES